MVLNFHAIASRLKHRCVGGFIFLVLFSASVFALPETKQEMEAWSYHKEWDQSTNVNYSLARSPLPRRGVYDTLRLEVVCKNKQLQFVLDSYNLITSKGSTFDFEYKIDNKDEVAIKMRTYPDTKRRGYADEQVMPIVEAMLSGQWIFIRVHTIIRTVLSSKISLQGAREPVQHVLADCGKTLPGEDSSSVGYGLADFERDFTSLTPAQQRQILDRVKQMIDTMR